MVRFGSVTCWNARIDASVQLKTPRQHEIRSKKSLQKYVSAYALRHVSDFRKAKDDTTTAQEDTDAVQEHGNGDEHPTLSQPEAQPSGETLRPASPKDREAGTLSLDIANSITGMYRILDLISEQGSGGLGAWSKYGMRTRC